MARRLKLRRVQASVESNHFKNEIVLRIIAFLLWNVFCFFEKIHKKIKVIMVTAIEDVQKMEEARKYGVEEYITKPLLLEQLEKTVLSLAEGIKST